MDVYLQRHGVSFYPFLVRFHLQIAYKKVRNLQIGVDKLVGKTSINLYITNYVVTYAHN